MKLYDPGTLNAFLVKHGITAAKRLGQHFLCSKSTVDAISNALAGCSGVLEIGPGPGVLTGPISDTSKQMIALELDDRMIVALRDSAPKADVRSQDALTANLSGILEGLPEPRGIVSNLPYYITGPLVTRIAEARSSFSIAVLMMQKEVAIRIMAEPGNGDRGSLSVYLQSQFDIRSICEVPAAAFIPPPKVDSMVLSLAPKPMPVAPERESAFFRLIRQSFGQPRKTLANNLVGGMSMSRDAALEAIARVGLDERIRPHMLTLDEWARLCEAL